MLKPSELSPAVSSLIAKLIPKYLDRDVCQVVAGAVPENTKVRSPSVRQLTSQ